MVAVEAVLIVTAVGGVVNACVRQALAADRRELTGLMPSPRFQPKQMTGFCNGLIAGDNVNLVTSAIPGELGNDGFIDNSDDTRLSSSRVKPFGYVR